MIKIACDVCEKEVEKAHEYGGNVSYTGFNEMCNACWGYLDEAKERLEKFVSRQERAQQKFIDGLVQEAKDAKA